MLKPTQVITADRKGSNNFSRTDVSLELRIATSRCRHLPFSLRSRDAATVRSTTMAAHLQAGFHCAGVSCKGRFETVTGAEHLYGRITLHNGMC